MINIDLNDEVYIFNKDNVLYVNGFSCDDNDYSIHIYFSFSEEIIIINNLTYLDYIKILDLLKKED